jgi:integrase/recombinase XerD
LKFGVDDNVEKQIREFLEELQQRKGYSHNTIEAYRNDLNQFMHFALNERPNLNGWTRVDKPLLLAFILHLKDREYTPSSVARKVAVLKSFYHSLVEHGGIELDPTATVGSPKVEKRLPQVLTPDEMERLLAAPLSHSTPKGFRDRAMLEALFASGMRVSELTALNIADVNLQDQTLHCIGRGDKRRVIPIGEQAAQALENYLQRGRPAMVKVGEVALFINPHGERLTRQGLWLVIKEYVKEAKISSPVTPHTLRHSHAVQLLNHGADLANVQRRLGHASIATTQMYQRMVDAPSDAEPPSQAANPTWEN